MDITTKRVADTGAIHLKDADGNPMYDADRKPCRVVLYSPGSAPYAEVEARQTNRAVKRMQDNDGKVTVATPEERTAEQAEDLAALTVGFENFTYPPAGEAKGRELFHALYADKKLGFISEQVLKALRDWGKFTASSATS